MIINKLGSIEFRLKELHDFTWLNKYGKAFWVIDETGSGCICIGMENGNKKYFCKIAGVNTTEAEVSPEESVKILKEAVHLYSDLSHPNLVKIIEHYDYNQFYVVVFEWMEGECLFDHWNFQKYQRDTTIKSPKEKFQQLSISKKLSTIDVLFSFLQNVNEKGYVAVDFYDGSIMYDFSTDKTTICDIDFFRKAPVINNKWTEWFGTKRFKAPEEYIKGSIIDEQTNIFTLGALIFEFFGYFSDEEIKQRYYNNQFLPCSYFNWQLNEESYQVAIKAVDPDKNKRYMTFDEFFTEWKMAISSTDCLYGGNTEKERFIKRCYELATEAGKKGYDTFGAILVHNGKILEEAENTANYKKGIFGHAEFNLVHKCANKYSDEILRESVLFTSCAPCGRCLGAIISLGIQTVVFGVSYKEFSKLTPFNHVPIDQEGLFKQLGINIRLIGPVLEDDGMHVFEYWGGEYHPLEDLIMEMDEIKKQNQ